MNDLKKKTIKSTILFITDDHDDFICLDNVLNHKYDLICVGSENEAIDCIKSNDKISTILIKAELAAVGDFSLLKQINEYNAFSIIPVLIVIHGEPRDADFSCVDIGAVDFITAPYNQKIIENRIENSIRLKKSATFDEIENMLRALPSNIYVKDKQCRYVFCTHYWHHLEIPDDENWTIKGKTDVDIRKDKENAIAAMQKDREIMETGKGTRYTIEINTDGARDFVEIIKEPIIDFDGNVSGIIGLINDVTEKETLRCMLEEKANTDELTGCYNRHSFSQYINTINKKEYMPISIISIDCNDLKYINDNLGHLKGDEYIKLSAIMMRLVIPEHCTTFRVGGDEFYIILPNTTLAQTNKYIEEMHEKEKEYKINDMCISLSYGASCINSADNDIMLCVDDADKKMYEYKREFKKNRKNKFMDNVRR